MKRLKFQEINLTQQSNPITQYRYIGMNGNTFSFKTSDGIVAQSITGSIGPQGITGHQGLTGPDGVQGPQGVTGTVGSIVNGPDGPTGSVGPNGETGTTGSVGPQGSTGPQGLTGVNGVTGSVGPTGSDSIIQGPQGVTGSIGIGPQGAQGTQGPTGGSPPYLTYTAIVNYSSGTFTVYQLENTIGDGSGDGTNDIEWQTNINYGGYIFPVIGSGSVYTANTNLITSSILSTASVSFFTNYLGVFVGQFTLPDKVPALRFFRHDNDAANVPNFNELYVEIKIYN